MTTAPRRSSVRFNPGRVAAALAGISCLLWPLAAHAATCVLIDEQRDGLSPEERASARTLFEDALTEEHQTVAREGCTETWTIYHVRLGDSVTVVVQGPRGMAKQRLNKIEDLPAMYSQMAHSLITGAAATTDSSAVNRKNVTSGQNQQNRVRADAIWYAKLGYGATTADDFHAGPQFGFGRRWELDRFGIDLGFLNFLMYQNSSEFEGVSAGWVEIGFDYFFDPSANNTFYIGAGLSLGSHAIPGGTRGEFTGGGLQTKGTLGYEMFRASTIRMLIQIEATAPLFQLSRTYFDETTAVQSKDHTYAPNLLLSLGLGWGNNNDDDDD
jgi:hypothetical protein